MDHLITSEEALNSSNSIVETTVNLGGSAAGLNTAVLRVSLLALLYVCKPAGKSWYWRMPSGIRGTAAGLGPYLVPLGYDFRGSYAGGIRGTAAGLQT